MISRFSTFASICTNLCLFFCSSLCTLNIVSLSFLTIPSSFLDPYLCFPQFVTLCNVVCAANQLYGSWSHIYITNMDIFDFDRSWSHMGTAFQLGFTRCTEHQTSDENIRNHIQILNPNTHFCGSKTNKKVTMQQINVVAGINCPYVRPT